MKKIVLNLSVKLLIITIIFFIFDKKALSETIVINKDIFYNIGDKTQYYEDKNSNLTIDDIEKNYTKYFNEHHGKDFFNFTYSKSTYWFAIKIKNNSLHENFVLEIGDNTLIEDIEIFYKNKNEKKYQSKNISIYSNNKDNKTSNYPIFFHKIATNEEFDLVLRLKSNFDFFFNINYGNKETFDTLNRKRLFFYGIYFGFMFLVSIYNLILYFMLKEKIHLYYFFYSIAFILVMLFVSGYGNMFFWDSELNKFFNAFNYINSITSTIFSIEFLQLKSKRKKIFKILQISIFISLIMILLVILGFNTIPYIYLPISSLLIFPVIYSAISIFREGYKPALSYLIAQGIFFTFIIIYIGKNTTLLPYNLFTSISLNIATSLDILLLSLAITDKINIYKKETELYQEKIIEQGRIFSSLLIDTQENERKKLSSELHDGIGQNLMVIKNKILLLINKLKENSKLNPENLNDIAINIDETSDEIRNISYSLHPYHIVSLGLTESLREMLSEVSVISDIEFEYKIDNLDNIFKSENELNIYRIIQEITTNTIKHSKAEKCIIEIKLENNKLFIFSKDNGIGFVKKEKNNGLGLMSINERIKSLNGIFSIKAIDNGTLIEIEIPIPE